MIKEKFRMYGRSQSVKTYVQTTRTHRTHTGIMRLIALCLLFTYVVGEPDEHFVPASFGDASPGVGFSGLPFLGTDEKQHPEIHLVVQTLLPGANATDGPKLPTQQNGPFSSSFGLPNIMAGPKPFVAEPIPHSEVQQKPGDLHGPFTPHGPETGHRPHTENLHKPDHPITGAHAMKPNHVPVLPGEYRPELKPNMSRQPKPERYPDPHGASKPSHLFSVLGTNSEIGQFPIKEPLQTQYTFSKPDFNPQTFMGPHHPPMIYPHRPDGPNPFWAKPNPGVGMQFLAKPPPVMMTHIVDKLLNGKFKVVANMMKLEAIPIPKQDSVPNFVTGIPEPKEVLEIKPFLPGSVASPVIIPGQSGGVPNEPVPEMFGAKNEVSIETLLKEYQSMVESSQVSHEAKTIVENKNVNVTTSTVPVTQPTTTEAPGMNDK